MLLFIAITVVKETAKPSFTTHSQQSSHALKNTFAPVKQWFYTIRQVAMIRKAQCACIRRRQQLLNKSASNNQSFQAISNSCNIHAQLSSNLTGNTVFQQGSDTNKPKQNRPTIRGRHTLMGKLSWTNEPLNPVSTPQLHYQD